MVAANDGVRLVVSFEFRVSGCEFRVTGDGLRGRVSGGEWRGAGIRDRKQRHH